MVVDAAERVADSQESRDRLERLCEDIVTDLEPRGIGRFPLAALDTGDQDAEAAARNAARHISSAFVIPHDAKKRQSDLVRDIFDNPYRPITLEPTWLTTTVMALAQAAYEFRSLPACTLDPDHLSILADALEDAGCDNADILAHCRDPGEHVRGCWVVDLILDKK